MLYALPCQTSAVRRWLLSECPVLSYRTEPWSLLSIRQSSTNCSERQCLQRRLQTLDDRYEEVRLCSIGAPLSFPFGESGNPRTNPITTSTPDPVALKDLQIGDRVIIGGKKYGTLKYLGPIHVSQGIWCGIKLDEPLGKNNGKLEGTRYFKCQHRFGVFAPIHRVEKVDMNSREARQLSRQSMISTTSFNQSNDSNSDDIDFSDISASSADPLHFSPRSPLKANSNEIDSSAHLNVLVDVIKEKDRALEQDRLESARAKENIDAMSARLLTLQQRYDVKIKENEKLISEQAQLRQLLENLQFQLEESRYNETNHRQQLQENEQYQPSFDEMEQNEEIEEKIRELESINELLLVEKQRLIDELEQEKENHRKQSTNLESIKVQYERLFKEKDQQSNALLEQVQRLQTQLTKAQEIGYDPFRLCLSSSLPRVF